MATRGGSGHGSRSSYVQGCRCRPCTNASAEYMRKYRAGSEGLMEGDSRHGTYNGYANHRCRCARCRHANTVRTRNRRARIGQEAA